ncbi:hypothetical protein F5X68DRAFT_255008 [Plectosphaerella plurivora]|uniref:SnoaL-like domain-containing protein n=1 Tax=Plectosphaerella plurivora TaxID=936078 RepID=A0A9P9ABL5_9PEZI|nr:hypothetical protein F5X68DRAFT_255008 [Plectosphaerella plurivora]
MSEHIKKIVTNAYQRVFGDLDPSAVDDHFAKDFIQHNPTVADGPDGVKQLIQRLVGEGVEKSTIEFKHVVVEGDTVVLHSRYKMGGHDWRFIDIYRVENDKLAEHWDAMIQWPESRANDNGLF